RNMPPTATDTVFQVERVSSSFEHLFVIITLQQENVCMLEDMFHICTSPTQVGQYTDIYLSISDHKTTRFLRIVIFWDTQHLQLAHTDIGIRRNEMHQVAG